MSDDMFYCSFVSIQYIICECGETFPTEEELKIHLEKEHIAKKERIDYKCGICDAHYDTEEECIEHYESSHIEVQLEEVDNVEGLPEETDIKDEKIILEEIYEAEPIEESVTVQVPTEQTISEDRKKKKKKATTNVKYIVCEVCGKSYASNAALKYHQRVHTGERPYKCTMCDKCFTMPLFLQIHTRTHTGEKPYACSLCPKAFSNRAALLRHDRVHTGIKPYECPRCGKSFTQSNSMKLHVNTVHLKMPAPYKSKTRRLKAKEREMMRNNMKRSFQSEDDTAVESISQESNLVEAEFTTLDFDKHGEVVKEELVEETEIMYDDVDSREITYEVVFGEQC